MATPQRVPPPKQPRLQMSGGEQALRREAGREAALGVEQRGDERLAHGEEHEEQQQAGDDHDDRRHHRVAGEASAPRDRSREHDGEREERDPGADAERQPPRSRGEAGRERPEHGEGGYAGGDTIEPTPRECRRGHRCGDERPEGAGAAARAGKRRGAPAQRPGQRGQRNKCNGRNHRGRAIAPDRHEDGRGSLRKG